MPSSKRLIESSSGRSPFSSWLTMVSSCLSESSNLGMFCVFANLLAGALDGRHVEEVVDEIVAKFDVEAARILGRVLGIGVVHREVATMRGGVEVYLAAKTVLPSRVTNQTHAAIGVDEEARGHFIFRTGP